MTKLSFAQLFLEQAALEIGRYQQSVGHLRALTLVQSIWRGRRARKAMHRVSTSGHFHARVFLFVVIIIFSTIIMIGIICFCLVALFYC